MHFEGHHQGEDGEQATESGTLFTTGQVDSGVEIGSGDTLTYETKDNLNIEQGTIEMWVKPLTWGGTDGAHHDFFSMARSNVDRIRIRKSANNYIECGVLGLTGQWAEAQYSIYNIWQPGEWHHIACSWNDEDDTIYLYVDNQLVAGSEVLPFNLGSAGSIMHIGTETNGAHPAEAVIDELMISNSSNRTVVGTALISPEHKKIIEANTTALDWRNATDRDNDAITYTLTIDNDADFSSPEVNVSGILYSNYTLNSSQELLDGDYWWKIVPNDGQIDGNRSDEEWYFTIAAEYPRVINTTYTPDPAYNIHNITFYGTVVNDTLIDRVWYTGNWSGTQQNYTADMLNTGNSYNVTINAGNFSDQENFNFRWYVNQTNNANGRGAMLEPRISNRAPDEPNGTYPADWQYINATSTWINWSNSSDLDFGNGCELGGCNLTFYLYGSIDIGNVSSEDESVLLYNGTDLSYNWTGLGIDAYYWKVVASDGILRNSSDVSAFTNDNTPPVITSLNETPDPINQSDNIVISANITDDGTVEFALLDFEGTNYSMWGWGGDIWNYTFNTSGLSLGIHDYTVYANDTSRNAATPASGSFNVTVSQPIVTINSPAGTNYTFTNIQINISAEGALSIDTILYNHNGTNVTYTSEIYFNFTDDQTYTLYAYANDTDNTWGSTSVVFSVNTSAADVTPPQMNVTASPSNDTATITVVTDEDANATLNYNLTVSLGNYYYNTSFTLNHTFTLYNLTENTTYYYNITSCDSSGNCNTTGPHNFTTASLSKNPPTVNRAISPTVMENGSGTNLTIDVTDTHLDKAWMVITQPNGTQETILLINGTPYQYNDTYQLDRYNVTFYANDTLGNTASNTTAFFTGIPVNATIFADEYDGAPLNTTLRLLTETGEELSFLEVFGNTSDPTINISYDFRFKAYENTITVKINKIPLSDVDGKRVRIDRHASTSGYLVTYGVNTTFPYTNITLTFAYNSTSYTNETLLELYKCDDYAIHTRICNSGWYNITENATQDLGVDTFTIEVTSLSGFSIREATASAPSTGGGGGGYTPPTIVPPPGDEDDICIEDWICSRWSDCEDGTQTRECEDWNDCGTEENMPASARVCESQVAEIIIEQPGRLHPEPAKMSWLLLLLLAAVFLTGGAIGFAPKAAHYIFPYVSDLLTHEVERKGWITLQEAGLLPEKARITEFKIKEKEDFKELINFVRAGPSVVLVDTKKLRIADMDALKSAIRVLKKIIEGEDGDILGYGMDYIIVTSYGIKIARPAMEKIEQDKEQSKNAKKGTTWKQMHEKSKKT